MREAPSSLPHSKDAAKAVRAANNLKAGKPLILLHIFYKAAPNRAITIGKREANQMKGCDSARNAECKCWVNIQ